MWPRAKRASDTMTRPGLSTLLYTLRNRTTNPPAPYARTRVSRLTQPILRTVKIEAERTRERKEERKRIPLLYSLAMYTLYQSTISWAALMLDVLRGVAPLWLSVVPPELCLPYQGIVLEDELYKNL